MALAYPQWLWGFEVFDSGSGQNNYIDLHRNTSTWAATVPAGVYTPDELASAVATALNTVDAANSYSCTFSYSTLKFTIAGASSFDLKWSSGTNAAKNSSGILGFINVPASGNNWQASHAYLLNALVVPSGVNSSSTQLWKCTTAGTSGGSQPTWPSSPTPFVTTQTDNTATWTFQGTIDKTATSSVTSDTAVAGAFSTASVWTAAEPLAFTSPVTVLQDWKASNAYSLGDTLVPSGANSGLSQVWKCTTAGTSGSTQPVWDANPVSNLTIKSDNTAAWTYQGPGTPASLAQRAIGTVQHISDGATMESVYFATVKYLRVGFLGLLPSEQIFMENFLNWISQGKRFTWQPDKNSTAFLKLCLVNPRIVADFYQWLTRPEVGYGVLTFYEALQ